MTRASLTRVPHGFSLIEVLMAVLILALGMLGLGAILPVVVQSQRVGADQTFGTLAGQNAELYLTRLKLVNHQFIGGPVENASRAFWSQWVGVRNYPEVLPDSAQWYVVPVDQNTGDLRPGYDLANSTLPPTTHARISLADRLTPSDSANAGEPQFVWDLAVRRMQPRTNNANDVQPADSSTMQAAIFVRRIDQRIRVGANQSLYKMLTDWQAPTASRRWPVSVDTATGLPTLDGQVGSGFAYSTPLSASLQIVTGTGPRSDTVRVTAAATAPNGGVDMNLDRTFSIISQRGQILIDQLGSVHTVLGPATESGQYDLRLATPLDPALGGTLNVVFTPQVPASVILLRLTK